MDEVNNARLLALATERMAAFDAKKTVSEAEVLKKFGISPDDIADADGVDIE